jgi:DNA polymerase III subunit gamma/tau
VSYEPLHHKYRPQTFADLVGQEAITTTLSNAIRLRRIAPAYLFTGPRGTGKTSSARILSKSLNCLSSPVPTAEPCGTCDVCQAITRGGALDVIEIDAASNTGVDNIRELIERAQFAPVQCRYKIYCLDEVHMLSTAAFNALLKTLEEPPDRVVFILATTDPQRVLPTIISRCQRFDFRRIPLQDMTDHLSFIAQTEQIAIAPTAVELVAQIAQGGLRDAESLLDQLSLLAGEITVERVWDLVGSVPEQDLMALSQAIATANPEVILERTRHLLDRGREPLIVLQNLTGFYRDLLIAKTAPNRRDLVAVTEPTWHRLVEFAQTLDLGNILAGQQHLRTCEVQVKNTTQPRLWLEVTLLGLISLPSTVNATASVPQARVSAPSPSPIPIRPIPSVPVPSVPVPSVPVPIVAPLTHSPSSNPPFHLQRQYRHRSLHLFQSTCQRRLLPRLPIPLLPHQNLPISTVPAPILSTWIKMMLLGLQIHWNPRRSQNHPSQYLLNRLWNGRSPKNLPLLPLFLQPLPHRLNRHPLLSPLCRRYLSPNQLLNLICPRSGNSF